MIFGAPALLLGLSLALAYLIPGSVVIPEWLANLIIFIVQLKIVLIKTLFFVAVFIWVRWTLPRFRFDQLMNLGWKVMIPLGVINIVVTSVGLILLR